MFYENFTTVQLNKEITRILNIFDTDKKSGYTFLTQKEEDDLIVRIVEIERKLNTLIVIPNVHNDCLGE